MTRRSVRVDPQFFAGLDAQLGPNRGPHGEPSSTDFLLWDLPPIADRFATAFDTLLPLFPNRDDYRYLVTTGRLVGAVLISGQLMNDGSIVLFEIDIDPGREPDDPA